MLLKKADVFGQEQRESTTKVAAARVAARAVLLKEAAAPLTSNYDVFLSHSYQNVGEVHALKRFLERFTLTVYVDWMVEDDLSRARVTAATAERLKARIARSRSLLVYPTDGAKTSRWMPWELGMADGLGKRVGVLPVVENHVSTETFRGNEYWGLYPYVDVAPCNGRNWLWANTSARVYVRFDEWFRGLDPQPR